MKAKTKSDKLYDNSYQSWNDKMSSFLRVVLFGFWCLQNEIMDFRVTFKLWPFLRMTRTSRENWQVDRKCYYLYDESALVKNYERYVAKERMKNLTIIFFVHYGGDLADTIF